MSPPPSCGRFTAHSVRRSYCLNFFRKSAELMSGDGGVGTILQLTFPPGIPGVERYKEQFTEIDNVNYIKESEIIDGDILKIGFLCYMYRFEIIAKGPSSSVIRSTIEYEIADQHPELKAMVSTSRLAAAAERFSAYIKKQKIARISS